ncbi:OsmC family protein [Roseovarius sp. LXJ103]|uniref:OsmC family protein n=1 Tax=Roseovarius carneus TaxID=2853164 RepID=UPI001C63B51D|nr:OsmC family protein [Roseovarius carneus]MBZ8119676.1 OsmC family protein [Roseovarius carneus]
MAEHDYTAHVRWTGNRGQGTAAYKGYDRTWSVETPGKPPIHCSNDPLLGGDPGLHNPEDMLIAALSACHMLWFLHLASNAGVAVHAYDDTPLAVGETDAQGASRFLRATLRPRIAVPDGTDLALLDALHARVHETCFIARSVNFPVDVPARYRIARS